MAERALIISVFPRNRPPREVNLIMEEMERLTESAGGEVAGRLVQKRDAPDSRTLLGRGKTEALRERVQSEKVDMVVFYNTLSRIQQRNLEESLETKVIDRTRLILDIFATRARTLEGKLQVELAQLMYLLPRLTGRGVALSRLGGGIGTRGPGETKLESDRRRINDRIAMIRKRLDGVIRHRDVQRKSRAHRPIPLVSLVGYTSAGKSTLFRQLTGKDTPVSRHLFSTLDPLLRRVDLSDLEPGCAFILSDTVGFIRDMPTELFRSFRATLEEVVHADLVFNIVDVSAPDHLFQEQEVLRVLKDIQVPQERVITVYNKMDLIRDTFPVSADTEVVRISARTGEGVDGLREVIFQKWFSSMRRYSLRINRVDFNPHALRRWAVIVSRQDHGDTVHLELLCKPEEMVQYRKKLGGGNP